MIPTCPTCNGTEVVLYGNRANNFWWAQPSRYDDVIGEECWCSWMDGSISVQVHDDMDLEPLHWKKEQHGDLNRIVSRFIESQVNRTTVLDGTEIKLLKWYVGQYAHKMIEMVKRLERYTDDYRESVAGWEYVIANIRDQADIHTTLKWLLERGIDPL